MGTQLRQRPDGGIGFVTDSTAEEVASFGGTFRGLKVAKVAIAGVAATTGGALFSWANPEGQTIICLLYTSPSPRDRTRSRMPSSA